MELEHFQKSNHSFPNIFFLCPLASLFFLGPVHPLSTLSYLSPVPFSGLILIPFLFGYHLSVIYYILYFPVPSSVPTLTLLRDLCHAFSESPNSNFSIIYLALNLSEYIISCNICICLIAHITLYRITTERADAQSYERNWSYSSDIEITSVA